MNLYEKANLISKTQNTADFILHRVHHNIITEQHGEMEIDELITKFNQKLLELERGEKTNEH